MKSKIVMFSLILVSFSFIGKAKTYKQTKIDVQQIKSKINIENIAQDSISKLFTEQLVNKIIPYWYGTKWSFEGHTPIPKHGKIACGYFVSTTLRDVGFNLNRYKMARKSPINEAKIVSLNSKIIEIENETVKENIQEIKNILKQGVYFLGFDESHVGYILKQDTSVYIIHSNYINFEGVVKEKIENSEAFSHYLKFHIAPISRNIELMKKWIGNLRLN